MMMMIDKREFVLLLDSLRRNRVSLQLEAEIDPIAIVTVASEIADRTGLSEDIALRVVENELGIRPLVAHTPFTKGDTIMDIDSRLERVFN